MTDIMGLMKQAKEMQAKMQIAQGLVADLSITGSSGGGMFSITLAGGGNMSALKIDTQLQSEDIELMEDLIVAAYQDAKIKLDQAQAQTMKDTMGDMPMPPGMKLPF